MYRCRFFALAILWGFGASLAAQESAKEAYHDLPAVGVSLLKPKGFEPAERFDGIQNPTTSVSIMAVRLPVDFAEFAKPFQAGAALPNRVKIESRADQDFANMKGCLIKASQNAGLVDVKKWVLIFGDASKTYMITGNAPGEPDDATVEQMKGFVLKTRLLKEDSASSMADLPFEVGSEKLKVSRGPLKMLFFTKDGVIPLKKPDDPFFMVGMSTSDIFLKDSKEFLADRIKKEPSQKGWKQSAPKEIEIAGLKGCVVETEGKGKNETPLRGYWAVLMSDKEYYLFGGTCGVEGAKEQFAEFSKVVHSFKFKDAKK